jgi:tRNA isopentenyl-2-thiomethyl-A-37 hydroxylase MiaE
MRAQKTDEINREVRLVNFGCLDRFNRSIGAQIITSEVDFVEVAEEAYLSWSHELGHYYQLNMWATRKDVPYGAIQPNKYFRTPEERQRAIDKYLVYAAKRAETIR